MLISNQFSHFLFEYLVIGGIQTGITLSFSFTGFIIYAKINKLHEPALRITYRDQESSFKDRLGYDNSVSAHQKNLQVLMIEMFRTKHGLNPPFMKEIFYQQTNQYNLRNDSDFNLPRVSSVIYGSETVRYRGPQLCCTLPLSIRHSTNLVEFKTKIKAWKGNECHCQCRLCRNFIPLLLNISNLRVQCVLFFLCCVA